MLNLCINHKDVAILVNQDDHGVGSTDHFLR